MDMSIQDVHNLFSLIVKKTRNEFLSHEQIDEFLHMAQMEYYAMLLGNYKQYQPGRPVAPVVYGMTQRTLDDMNPFKEKVSFQNTPYNPTSNPYGVSDGILVLPDNYEYLESIQSLAYKNGISRERPVKIVDGEEWAWRVDSVMLPPTQYDPIAMMDGAGGTVNGFDIGDKRRVRFAPKSISGTLYYFRLPNKPFYAYIVVGRTETFNPNTSVDLEWNTVSTMNIIVRALQLAGVRTEDNLVVQAMNNEEMTGE